MVFKSIELVQPSVLRLIECESQPLLKNEVRIQVVVAGVCGSDLKNIRNPVTLPQIPGHEFSGTLIEIGGDFKDQFEVGDRISVFPLIGCLQCSACKTKNYRDCENKKSLGFQLPGAFSQEVVVDGNFVIPLYDKISYLEGALLEPLCCGYRVMKEIEKDYAVVDDVHIVIVGDGPIALSDVQGLKAGLFNNITLIGKHLKRIDVAKRLGVKNCFNLDDCLTKLPQLPKIEICILAAGDQEMLIDLLPLMNRGGMIFPQSRVDDKKILFQMEKKNITFGRAFAYFMEDFFEVMNLIIKKKIDVNALVTKKFLLEEVANVYKDFFNKSNQIKTVIVNEDQK